MLFRSCQRRSLIASLLDFATDELQTCNEHIREGPLRLHSLAFSDDGAVNRHNHRYWAPENSRCFVQQSFTRRRRRYGLQFVLTCRLVGLFIFDQAVYGERYLSIVQEQFCPEMKRFRFKEKMIFIGSKVAIDRKFPGRWMGRGGPVRWPARSPHQAPCDFFHGASSSPKFTALVQGT